MTKSFKTLGTLSLLLMLAAPLAAQEAAPEAPGRGPGDGTGERRERPEGWEGRRRGDGEGRGEGRRRGPVDLETIEITAPGRLIFSGRNAQHESKGIFTSWKFTEVSLPEGDFTKGKVAFEVDLTSVVANRGPLTGHLKSPDFFNVELLPKATVTLANATKAAEAENTYTATATVMFGEAKADVPVSFTVSAENPRHVKGEATLSRTALKVGAPYNAEDPRSVADEIKVSFDAVLPDAVPAG